ncbi:MAG: hypothetical protein JW807_04575 [Spirochaetes bacterium]|nr:hypothetical protein [Spirochaetota bacterium]
MWHKITVYIFLSAAILLGGAVYGQKTGAGGAAVDEGMRDPRIPKLNERLNKALEALKLEPDKDGKHTILVESGYHYDKLERTFFMYHKKAFLYMSGNSVSKIIFEYYQFNMTSHVREVKTYTVSTPGSEDLKQLAIEYKTNIGKTEKYLLADLMRIDTRRDVVAQYHSYLMALVYKLEIYRDKLASKQSSLIERTIQLDQ